MPFSLPRHVSLPAILATSSATLLLAYLYALSHRPGYPDQYTVNNREYSESDPWTYGFPKWFGKGANPYDAQPTTRAGISDLDVLLWIDLPRDSPNSHHALATVKALQNSSSVSPRIISNVGQEVYEPSRLVEGAGCGDWIWRIGETSTSVNVCPESVWISEILQSSTGLSTKQHDARANIELLSRPQQLFEAESDYASLKEAFPASWEMGYLSHILPFVTTYFPSSRKRRRSVTYFPSADTALDKYPSLSWGSGWSIYKPTNKPPQMQDERDPWATGSLSRMYWDKEDRRRAQAMRDSDICVLEGWENGLLGTESAQAMLSGCILAMTSPQIHHDILQPLIIPMPKSAYVSGALPLEAVAVALARISDEELARKSMKSFIVARQLLTPTNRVNSVLDIVQTWKEGARGYNLPNAFKWNCDSEPRPPWC